MYPNNNLAASPQLISWKWKIPHTSQSFLQYRKMINSANSPPPPQYPKMVNFAESFPQCSTCICAPVNQASFWLLCVKSYSADQKTSSIVVYRSLLSAHTAQALILVKTFKALHERVLLKPARAQGPPLQII